MGGLSGAADHDKQERPLKDTEFRVVEVSLLIYLCLAWRKCVIIVRYLVGEVCGYTTLKLGQVERGRYINPLTVIGNNNNQRSLYKKKKNKKIRIGST